MARYAARQARESVAGTAPWSGRTAPCRRNLSAPHKVAASATAPGTCRLPAPDRLPTLWQPSLGSGAAHRSNQQVARSIMLNVLRQKAGSWVVKVLLLLLVVSFAIWGIGDVFFGGVAQSGRRHGRQLGDLGDRAGGRLQPVAERSAAAGSAAASIASRRSSSALMQQALQDLIARRLVDLRAQDMGLTVADDTLRRWSPSDPVFQTDGQFDRARFEQLLRASGLTEQSYLASLRQDVVRSTLTGSLAGPVVVPETLVDALYRYRNEQRRGHLRGGHGDIDHRPAGADRRGARRPSTRRIRTSSRRPSTARLTFVTLQPEDLLDEVEIGDERDRGRVSGADRELPDAGAAHRGAAAGARPGDDRAGGGAGRRAARLRRGGQGAGRSGRQRRPARRGHQGGSAARDWRRRCSRSPRARSASRWRARSAGTCSRSPRSCRRTVVPLAEARDELAQELALDRGQATGCRIWRRGSTTSWRPGVEPGGCRRRGRPRGEVGGRDRCPGQGPPKASGPRRCPRGRSSCEVAFETPAGESEPARGDRGRQLLRAPGRRGRCRPGSSRSTRCGRSWSRAGRPSSAASWRASGPRSCSRAWRTGRRSTELAAEHGASTVTPIEPVKRARGRQRSGHQPGGRARAVRDRAGRGRRRGGRARRRLRAWSRPTR